MSLRVTQWLKKLNHFRKSVNVIPNIFYYGYIVSISGLLIHVKGLKVPIGTICLIEHYIEGKFFQVESEVIGFKEKIILLMLLKNIDGIQFGSRVFVKIKNGVFVFFRQVPISAKLLGRVIDSIGRPLDGLSNFDLENHFTLNSPQINPLYRDSITQILDVGIKAINGLLTIGRGQRMGLFSHSGLGKSVLLAMMAKYTEADIIIIALIGERGREVKEFIHDTLGKNGLMRSIVIAVPIDSSPLSQIQGAHYATRIAEYFRDSNYHVLLIMDSLTRYAMAYRQIALSMGELPVSRGYPPSIFNKIYHLVERVGNGMNGCGSITAFYTVLTENSLDDDPILEMVRSVLDGHIILSSLYAESGHYPAIDITHSVSRVMFRLVSNKHYKRACYIKKLASIYQSNQDLIKIGAYITGNDPFLDKSISLWPIIEKFLIQNTFESYSYQDSYKRLKNILI